MATEDGVRRVVTYERVSSEEQRDRATIRTQTDELARHLASLPDVRIVGRYQDEGVSGTIPFAQRPGGSRLLRDAASGGFTEIWVYRLDRLGRDDVDPIVVRRQLEGLGVTVNSVVEGHPDEFMYAILVAVAAQERRSILRRSIDGMDRTAREGRYTGGIAPFGYRVEGKKPSTRLVPDDEPFWSDLSAADLIRQIYQWLVDGWTCVRIAAELNALGVPTAASRSGPGTRVKAVQPRWRAGRIRNMVVNTVYKGEYHYGKRATHRKTTIAGFIPALVSPETWEAAQDTLARNRIMPKNTPRTYLLRTVMKCGLDGRTYVGTMSRDKVWYRCNGKFAERGPSGVPCTGKGIDGSKLEPLIWGDIERFLRAPGTLLEELSPDREAERSEAVEEAQRITLERQLADLDRQQDAAVDLNIRGMLSIERLQTQLDRINAEQASVRDRLAKHSPVEPEVASFVTRDLVDELRQRLDRGLTDSERQEIVRLLVGRITVHTEQHDGVVSLRLVVDYRFGGVSGDHTVVSTPDDRGSWQPRAGSARERWRSRERARW
ncbi:MAG: recombinase family protein [Dehalococcoidia bacterium]